MANGELRAHVLGFEPIEDLLRTLTLRVTRVVHPSGEHRELFESVTLLLSEHFPDPDKRPSREDVENWFWKSNFSSIAKRSNYWSELLFAIHYPGQVIGYFYISVDHGRKLGWVTFFGIYKPWREDGRTSFVWEKLKEEVLRIFPHITRVYYEDDIVPDGFLGNGEGLPANLENGEGRSISRSLWLLELYRSIGAFWLSGADDRPAQFIHPRIMLPLEHVMGESKQHLLYHPLSQEAKAGPVEEPEAGQADLVVASYHDGFFQGWGPLGHDLSGYSEYIREIGKKQAGLLGGPAGLAPIRIGRRGKDLMRKMGRDFI